MFDIYNKMLTSNYSLSLSEKLFISFSWLKKNIVSNSSDYFRKLSESCSSRTGEKTHPAGNGDIPKCVCGDNSLSRLHLTYFRCCFWQWRAVELSCNYTRQQWMQFILQAFWFVRWISSFMNKLTMKLI